ncbi:hypothetical protein BBJ28_00011554 [Nothophytophthora sp. Chile5]|nr:hypothetical protein BBJ28_00011554 [Nothophytophthora sp. Chile5]
MSTGGEDVVEATAETTEDTVAEGDEEAQAADDLLEEFYSFTYEKAVLLIREVACECPERGLLLLRMRDELRLTIEAYQTLYHNSIAYGRQKAVQAEGGVGELEGEIHRLEAEREQLIAAKRELTHKVRFLEEQRSEEEKKRELRHAHAVQYLQTQRQELEVFHREMTQDPTWK